MTIDEVKDMLPQKPERMEAVEEPKRSEFSFILKNSPQWVAEPGAEGGHEPLVEFFGQPDSVGEVSALAIGAEHARELHGRYLDRRIIPSFLHTFLQFLPQFAFLILLYGLHKR